MRLDEDSKLAVITATHTRTTSGSSPLSKRHFQSSGTAARLSRGWRADIIVDNRFVHCPCGSQWKLLIRDGIFPQFACHSGNINLGLCRTGF